MIVCGRDVMLDVWCAVEKCAILLRGKLWTSRTIHYLLRTCEIRQWTNILHFTWKEDRINLEK